MYHNYFQQIEKIKKLSFAIYGKFLRFAAKLPKQTPVIVQFITE
jgi:hypothetical protein